MSNVKCECQMSTDKYQKSKVEYQMTNVKSKKTNDKMSKCKNVKTSNVNMLICQQVKL